MPLYSYICPQCGAEKDAFNRVSDRHANAPECHGAMDIKLQPNLGHVQQSFSGKCPVTGQVISTYRQRRRVMDEHGLIDQRDCLGSKRSYEKAKKEWERNEELGSLLKQKDLPDKVLDKYRPALPTSV